jgi:hypothetical protein
MPFDVKKGIGTAAHAAIAFMAAKKAGPEAVSAYMYGVQLEQRRRALEQQKQSQVDYTRQRQDTLDQRVEADRQWTRERQTEADRRAEEGLQTRRMEAATSEFVPTLPEVANEYGDPVEAENQAFAQSARTAARFNLPADALSGLIPNMAPPITKAAKRDAAGLLAAARAGTKGSGPLDDTNISWHFDAMTKPLQAALIARGHVAGSPVKPSALNALYGGPVHPQTGAPSFSQIDPEATTTGSFDAHFLDVLAAEESTLGRPVSRAERAALRLKARRAYELADTRPATEPAGIRAQRVANLRDRLYNEIADGNVLSPDLLGEIQTLGLDPTAEERRARLAYNEDVNELERGMRPTRDAYGVEEDPAAVEARRERARRALRRNGGNPPPAPAGGGRGAGPGSAGTADQTVTRTELKAVAQRMGMSEAQAEQQAVARGLQVVER